MEPFIRHEGVVLPLDRVNVDTDAIIPKQYLQSTARSGYGPFLFDSWRYLDPGHLGMDTSQRRLNPDFIMNEPRYAGASILLARNNFGCGSSREHAVWALLDAGFRAVIAPSFGDIFYNNCFQNGLLPAIVTEADCEALFSWALHETSASPRLLVDLQEATIRRGDGGGQPLHFAIEPFRRQALLRGLDAIGETLARSERIAAFEARHREVMPWLFAEGAS